MSDAGEDVAVALGELDRLVRSSDCMTLKDLQVEHTYLREYVKYFSQLLSKMLEDKARADALMARRPHEQRPTGDKAAVLLKSTLKSTGTSESWQN